MFLCLLLLSGNTWTFGFCPLQRMGIPLVWCVVLSSIESIFVFDFYVNHRVAIYLFLADRWNDWILIPDHKALCGKPKKASR